MQKGRASETARISALMRATHRLLDARPWIFDDRLAAALAGLDTDQRLREALDIFQHQLSTFGTSAEVAEWIRASRLGVVLRGRYTEDALVSAINDGITQYVILGAGLDSFAHRRGDLLEHLRVFEVDHPDTQRSKRDRLHALGLATPAQLFYVAVDFAQQPRICDALLQSEFDPTRPAFFSFLGVSWYLSAELFDRCLREVVSSAPGSQIVLDYLQPKEALCDSDRTVLGMLERMAAGHGEPGGTCFTPTAMSQRLQQLGFASSVNFGAREANPLYCANRIDGLNIPELLYLSKAEVA